jgi:hypothetical protein
VQDLPGRGRGLVAARDLQPGEVVLSDAPLLLTPAQEARTAVCATCLRIVGEWHCAHRQLPNLLTSHGFAGYD